MTAKEILRELVAIPTPSEASNVSLIEWVVAFLTDRGWHCTPYLYRDENGVAKANLVARPAHAPSDSAFGLAFICHTDTVPFAKEWKHALVLSERAETRMLHGCGACDVKGSLACFLAALDSTPVNRIRPDAALMLTADEEIGCKGMERLLEQATFTIASALVSEPTQLRPGIAGKGYGLARVTVHGAEAHSAFPEKGVPAILFASRFLHCLEEEIAQRTAIADPLFHPPHATFNVGVIEGGTAKNIIPGACSFLVEWRPVPGEDPKAPLAMLHQIAGAIRATEPRLGIEIEPLRADAGFAPAQEGALQQRLRELLPVHRAPTGISFGSEATRLARVAEEVIVIGPGDMQTAHSDRECVPVSELEDWTQILRALLQLA